MAIRVAFTDEKARATAEAIALLPALEPPLEEVPVAIEVPAKKGFLCNCSRNQAVSSFVGFPLCKLILLRCLDRLYH